MRKASRIIIYVFLIIGLSACGNNTEQPNSSESDSSSFAPAESSILEAVNKGDVISDTDDSQNQTDENDDENEDQEIPYMPEYEVTYEMLNTEYLPAESPDGRYVLHTLKDSFEGSPIYLYDTYEQDIKMLKIAGGSGFRYAFGHDNLAIAMGINRLIFCDPQTGEQIDNFIDFDYTKDGERTIFGICYDAEQEKYIAAWREYGTKTGFNIGPIPPDERPEIIQRMSEGYYPFYLGVFDKEGTYLWDIETGLSVMGAMQHFVIIVDMEAIGSGMVRMSDSSLIDSNGQRTPVVEMSYMDK